MASFGIRLAAIESRLLIIRPTLMMIKGGVPAPDGPRFAYAEEHRWDRLEGEPLEVFMTRVSASATQSRLSVVIMGGLDSHQVEVEGRLIPDSAS